MRRKKDKRKQEREAKRLYPKRMDDESLTLSGRRTSGSEERRSCVVCVR